MQIMDAYSDLHIQYGMQK